jgi:hypothetical protein
LTRIMNPTPLNLGPEAAAEPPINRLTLQIIRDAIRLKADAILLELDLEIHLQAHEEWKAFQQALQAKSLTKDQIPFKLGRLPNSCEVTYIIGGKREQMRPLSGELFGNVVNILLLAMGIPPWTKGVISAPLETIKPTSKWIFESNNVTRQIHLQRIRSK